VDLSGASAQREPVGLLGLRAITDRTQRASTSTWRKATGPKALGGFGGVTPGPVKIRRGSPVPADQEGKKLRPEMDAADSVSPQGPRAKRRISRLDLRKLSNRLHCERVWMKGSPYPANAYLVATENNQAIKF
jgi:hypothetical protein